MKKQNDWKLLADLNVSVRTTDYLKQEGFDIVRIDKSILTDEQIVDLAKKEGRTILTFDKDFGEIYYFADKKSSTIIILYLKNQSPENINPIIKSFLETTEFNQLKNKLIILYEGRYRVIG